MPNVLPFPRPANDDAAHTIGQIDRALAQVQLAIDRGYEHAEKMETDTDLAPLHADPRFSALFRDWRTKRADLN